MAEWNVSCKKYTEREKSRSSSLWIFDIADMHTLALIFLTCQISLNAMCIQTHLPVEWQAEGTIYTQQVRTFLNRFIHHKHIRITYFFPFLTRVNSPLSSQHRDTHSYTHQVRVPLPLSLSLLAWSINLSKVQSSPLFTLFFLSAPENKSNRRLQLEWKEREREYSGLSGQLNLKDLQGQKQLCQMASETKCICKWKAWRFWIMKFDKRMAKYTYLFKFIEFYLSTKCFKVIESINIVERVPVVSLS